MLRWPAIISFNALHMNSHVTVVKEGIIHSIYKGLEFDHRIVFVYPFSLPFS